MAQLAVGTLAPNGLPAGAVARGTRPRDRGGTAATAVSTPGRLALGVGETALPLAVRTALVAGNRPRRLTDFTRDRPREVALALAGLTFERLLAPARRTADGGRPLAAATGQQAAVTPLTPSDAGRRTLGAVENRGAVTVRAGVEGVLCGRPVLAVFERVGVTVRALGELHPCERRVRLLHLLGVPDVSQLPVGHREQNRVRIETDVRHRREKVVRKIIGQFLSEEVDHVLWTVEVGREFLARPPRVSFEDVVDHTATKQTPYK